MVLFADWDLQDKPSAGLDKMREKELLQMTCLLQVKGSKANYQAPNTGPTFLWAIFQEIISNCNPIIMDRPKWTQGGWIRVLIDWCILLIHSITRKWPKQMSRVSWRTPSWFPGWTARNPQVLPDRKGSCQRLHWRETWLRFETVLHFRLGYNLTGKVQLSGTSPQISTPPQGSNKISRMFCFACLIVVVWQCCHFVSLEQWEHTHSDSSSKQRQRPRLREHHADENETGTGEKATGWTAWSARGRRGIASGWKNGNDRLNVKYNTHKNRPVYPINLSVTELGRS